MTKHPILGLWTELLSDDRKAYRLAGLTACVSLLVWSLVVLRFGSIPAEDAFILFRYARHVASGYGVVWNLTGPHAEGATDFLWLSGVALLTLVTRDPVVAARALSTACLVALGLLLQNYLVNRRNFPAVVFALATVCYLFSPLPVHLLNGFSPPMYALVLVFNTALMLNIMEGERSQRHFIAWGAMLLIVGLTRPEGNLFCAVQIAILALQSRTYDRRTVKWLWRGVLLGYIAPGLTYFLIRWWYFGLALPLPFYVKAVNQTSLALTLQTNAAALGLHLGLPLLGIGFILTRGLRQEVHGCTILTAVVPPMALLLGYLPITQSQNIAYRFQYPSFAVLIFLCIVKIGQLAQHRGAPDSWKAATLLLFSVGWGTVSAVPVPEPAGSGIWVGSRLQALAGRGYSLATTESGKLPYFSRWRTLDSYGLNDPVVATTGLNYRYWKDVSPAVVMIHPASGWEIYKDARPPAGEGHRREIIEHMRSDGRYVLAAVIQRIGRSGRLQPGEYDLYFVSKACRDYSTIMNILQAVPGATYREAPLVLVRYLGKDGAGTLGREFR